MHVRSIHSDEVCTQDPRLFGLPEFGKQSSFDVHGQFPFASSWFAHDVVFESQTPPADGQSLFVGEHEMEGSMSQYPHEEVSSSPPPPPQSPLEMHFP